MKKQSKSLLTIILVLLISVGGYLGFNNNNPESISVSSNEKLLSLKYTGDPYVILNGDNADFKEKDMTTKNYIRLSELDSLGRCGMAMACLSEKDMPKEKRGSIGMIKPSGWHTVRYDGLVQGNYLYNRCHLLAYSICGVLADERNLITGTRYMNIEGMCDQEERIRNYMKSTGNHVLYRVTPVFKGDELVARGVHIEAKSVEDDGKSLNLNNYAFNVQPKIKINYATGESRKE